MGRWDTQLGIAEKRIDGTLVGYQVGFICGNSFLQSIRRNVVYKNLEDAQTVLDSLEDNTRGTRKEMKVISKGKIRFPCGEDFGRYNRDW